MSLQEGQFVWVSGEPFAFNSLNFEVNNVHNCILLPRSIGNGWSTVPCTLSELLSGTIILRPICKQEQTTTSESLDIGN